MFGSDALVIIDQLRSELATGARTIALKNKMRAVSCSLARHHRREKARHCAFKQVAFQKFGNRAEIYIGPDWGRF